MRDTLRRARIAPILLGVIVLSLGCGQDDFELFHPPPSSLTAKMVLECSISDDGRVAAKITSDGRFALADVANRRIAWRRRVPANSVHAVAVAPAGTLLAYSLNCRQLVVEDMHGVIQGRYSFPGDCLDVHALAMGESGYPIAMGAGGRGIYVLDQAGGAIRAVKPASSYRGQSAGVQSISIDDRARWLVAAWMSGAEPEQTAFAPPSTRRHAVWWQQTGNGSGVGATVFDVKSKSVVAELEGTLNPCSAGLSPDGKFMVIGYDGVSLWQMSDGRRLWSSSVFTGSATDFLWGGRFVVTEMFGPVSDPVPRAVILDASTGATLGAAIYEAHKSDIMTRGNFSARNSDKFLVAHRTGMVDVYQVSADGKTITKYWEF